MSFTSNEKNVLLDAFVRKDIAGATGIVDIYGGGLDTLMSEGGVDTAVCAEQVYTAGTDTYDAANSAVTVDLMEYATDVLAQAAYVPSVSTTNNISLDMSNMHMNGFRDLGFYKIVDGNTGTNAFDCTDAIVGSYLSIDLLYGNSAAITVMSMYVTGAGFDGEYSLQYSDDRVTWTSMATAWTPSSSGWNNKTVDSNGKHRFYRFLLTKVPTVDKPVAEVLLKKIDVQSYTESTIVNQGTYSLHLFASSGNSATETFTKDTSAAPIDLTGTGSFLGDKVYFMARASRTGSNFKVGLTNDAGGTPVTTEVTCNITTADTWQEFAIDFSAVAAGDKDDIDAIVITILDDTADNDIYIDNMVANGRMLVQSKAYTATSAPSTIKAVVFEEDGVSAVPNTDFKLFVSRDGGTTWTEATLGTGIDAVLTAATAKGYPAEVDVSGQPSGTDVRWRFVSYNSKVIKLHGAALSWA